MTILSITFHIEEKKISEWDSYLVSSVLPEIETFGCKFLLSEVITEMLSEGKNTNLLLLFDDEKKRTAFTEEGFSIFSNKIMEKFQESVLIFKTILNPLKINI